MNFDWQNLVVVLLVASASVYVLRGLWRLGRTMSGDASGKLSACGSCSSCSSATTLQPVIIDLHLPAQTTASAPEKTNGGH